MQESNETESNLDSINTGAQHDGFEQQGDTDADAFAVLGLLLIIACTIVYYLGG